MSEPVRTSRKRALSTGVTTSMRARRLASRAELEALKSLSDEELLGHYLEDETALGDAAIELLSDRYTAKLFRTAYVKLGSHEDAEEVAYEVLAYMAENAAKFDPGRGCVSTWLFMRLGTVCHRHWRTARRARRRLARLVERIHDPSFQFADAWGDPEASAVQAAEQDHVAKALAQLKPQDRKVLELFHFAELSLAEIEPILGVPPKNLKVRLHRARKRLEKIMTQEDVT